jgi:hypothetical protein
MSSSVRMSNSKFLIPNGRRLVALAAGLVVLAMFSGCDLLNILLGTDSTPPTCAISSPADSAAVNGVVQIAATAYDSVGVERVVFYVDGATVGTDSSVPYSASWDASALSEGSWHSLSCAAYDLAQNKGTSAAVAVQVAAIGQTSVYHGELDVPARGRQAVWFNARVGDTLAGEVLVVTGGTLSSFLWMDSDNYQNYIANQSYTALFRQDSVSQMSMQQEAASAGRLYLVFANDGNSAVKCWARFVLE